MIWSGGELTDFELKLKYRLSAVKWAMRGYHDDIDGKDQWSGQNYEER